VLAGASFDELALPLEESILLPVVSGLSGLVLPVPLEPVPVLVPPGVTGPDVLLGSGLRSGGVAVCAIATPIMPAVATVETAVIQNLVAFIFIAP
jgi:hypothetical protein